MALFKICPKCGEKKLFLSITSEGICTACRDAIRAEKQRQIESQERININAAEDLYNRAVKLWNRSIKDWYYLSFENLHTPRDIEAALSDCDEFISLVRKFPTTEKFPDVFQQHCEYLSKDGCKNNDFGNFDIADTDGQRVAVNFDGLITAGERKKEKLQKVLFSTEEFDKLVANIAQVDISIDSEAEYIPPSDSSVYSLNTTNITSRTALSKLNSFYVIDLETTGLNPIKDEILQISAVKFLNFEPIEAFTTYIKPRKEIPLRSAQINGIMPEDVEDAPRIEMVMKQLDAFLTESITGTNPPIIGHNLSFDYHFLATNGSKAFLRTRKFYDTLELSRRQFTYEDNYKLDSLIKSRLNVLREDAHTALSDALATGLLFKKICQDRIGF